MSRFRNGMRVIEAWQQPSGDWLVAEGPRSYLQADADFRASWEPVDAGARRMWRGVGLRVVGLNVGRRGYVRGRAGRGNRKPP